MEAVPRMPMISFDLKKSIKSVEFGPTLKKYIAYKYCEDASSYSKEITEFDQLRTSASKVSTDFIGCSLLKKYYSQLCYIQKRFPLTEEDDSNITFTWEDAHTGVAYSQPDVRFEQACILYNIGALHSILGAMDTRQSAEGMKISCTHFQCAAWALQHLHDSFPPSWSQDMDHELLTFQVNLMLAQAQECILEKSMTDNRKSTITAKVAAQIVEYYRQALKNIEPFVGSIKKSKDWKKRMELKSKYYECVMYLYMGNQAEDQQKWGERLAFFQVSLKKLDECIKLTKKDQNDILEALRFTMDVVGGKHNAAKKDNDFIYNEKVPDVDSLPDVKGASLVKGIAFDINDPEIAGPDIFSRLVPMEAHQASSMYSEEKAQILRAVSGEIDEKNEELVQFLASLQLDQSKLSPEPDRLPQLLLEKCAAISVQPHAVKDLVDAMQKLSNISLDVNNTLEDIEETLTDEEHKEKEFQEICGKRAPNIIISEIRKEWSKYKEGHTKASQSNTDLHKAMNEHISRLKLLAGPLEELQAAVPSLEAVRSGEDSVIIEKLMMLLSKVDEMKNQRHMLNEQLRTGIQNDDITKILVTRGEKNQEEFFKEQLQKHDQTVTYIRQNLAAQDNILRALTETNADYANIRRATADITQRRESMIQSLIQSYDVYEDLLAKSKKGIEFYEKLEGNVNKLYQRLKGVCKVQDEEREQILGRIRPKGPPPARPSAPKPSIKDSTDSPSLQPDGSEEYQGPTLKDFLPFMKPQTFGNLKSIPAALPPELSSLPSVAANLPQPASQAFPQPVGTGAPGLPNGQVTNTNFRSLPHSVPNAVIPPAGTTPQVSGYGATSSHSAMGQPADLGYHPAVMRPESAHTVDTVHAPIVTPGQVPSVQHVPPTSLNPYPASQAPSQNPNLNPNIVSRGPSHSPSPARNVPQAQPYSQPGTQPMPNQFTNAHQPAQFPISSQQYPVNQPTPPGGGYTNQGQNVRQPNQVYQNQPGMVQRPPQPTQNFPQTSTYQQYGPTSNTYPSQGYAGQPVPNQTIPQTQVQPGYQVPQGQPTGYGTQQNINRQVPQSQPNLPNQMAGQGQPTFQGQGVMGQGQVQGQRPQNIGQVQLPGPGPRNMSASAQAPSQIPQSQSPRPPQGQPMPFVGQGHPGDPGQGQMPGTGQGVGQQRFPASQGQMPHGGQGQVPPGGQGQIPRAQVPVSQVPGQVGQGQQFQGQTWQSQPRMPNQQYVGGNQSPQMMGNRPQVQGQLPIQGQGQMPVQGQMPGQVQGQRSVQGQPQMLGQGQGQRPVPGQPQMPVQGQGQMPAQSQGQNVQVPQNMQYGNQAPPANQRNLYPGQNQGQGQHQGQQPGYQQGYQMPPHQGRGSPHQQPTKQMTPPPQFQQQGYGSGQVQGHPGNLQQGQGHIPQGSPHHQVQGTVPYQQPPAFQNTSIPQQGQGYPTQQSKVAPLQLQPGAKPIPQLPSPLPNNLQQPLLPTASTQQQYQQGDPTVVSSGGPTQNYQNNTRPNAGNALPPGGPQQNYQQQTNTPPNAVTAVAPGGPQQNYQQQTNTPPNTVTAVPPGGPQRNYQTPPNTGTAMPLSGLTVAGQGQFPLIRQNSGSSTDDLLSSSPSHSAPTNEHVLTPKVLTAEDIQQQKEEELRNTIRQKHSDPYADRATLEGLRRDVEDLERKVASLTRKEQDGGLSVLDAEWKVIAEDQERESKKQSMAIAKCYPMKNRYPDIMPYDSSRVSLTMQKDDYINASHIDSLAASCPKFIATQAPLPVTYSDFWLMVYEQGSEVVVLLMRDFETNKQKPHVYWPTEKGQRISHGPIELTLQGLKEKDYWQERLITLSHRETRNSRTIIHLQFTAWPTSGIPDNSEPLLLFISEVHSFYKQQRNLMKPVVVHCGSGVCRTGIFCVIYTAIQEMDMGNGIISIVETIKRLRQKRKYMVEEKDHLKFCYEAVLQYALDLLANRGMLTKKQSNNSKKQLEQKSSHHTNEDVILGELSSFRDIQSSVEKFHVKNQKPEDQNSDTASLSSMDAPNVFNSAMTSSQTSNHNGVNSFDELFDTPDQMTSSTEAPSKLRAERSRSNSNSSAQSLGSFTNSPQHKNSSLQNMPSSLADLQNPNTFTLDTAAPPGKKKITKASFLNPSSGIQDNVTGDSSDPFSSLDPMWSISKDQSDSS